MSQRLTLEIPDELYHALQQEATSKAKAVEQVLLDRVRPYATPPERGTVDALTPSYGAWATEPELQATGRCVAKGRP